MSIESELEVLQNNFIQNSLLFEWNNYLIRGAIYCDGKQREKESWPFIFAQEEFQWVNAAVWDVTGEKPLLVATWVFSPSGDETNLFYLEEHSQNIFEFDKLIRKNNFNLPAACARHDAFGCSSGDEAVATFSCPALETISLEQLKVSTVDPSKPDLSESTF